MGGGGAMDDKFSGYDENLGEANNAEFGPDAVPMVVAAMAEGVAEAASDAEEALAMCRDLAQSEDLSEADYLELIDQVESLTGWELAEDSDEV